jgi:DNA-binding MarR family transcriptional regulator
MISIYETCLLHARADRALRAAVAGQLEAYKLTMMEWLLLGVVCSGPPAGISMSSAAQTLDVTLPQITALANKLLNLKLIRQKTQTHDRRSRHITPTGKGKTVLEDIEEVLSPAISKLIAELPEDHVEGYVRTITWLSKQKKPEVPKRKDTPESSPSPAD